jgi:hypothetical protein
LTAKRLAQRLERFWFAEIPAEPLLLFRSCFGAAVLLSLLGLLPDLDFLFGVGGLIRGHSDRYFSLLHWLPPSDFSVWLTFSLTFAGALGLLFGFFPRLSAFAVYLGLLSFSNADPIGSGGERLERLFALLLVFARPRETGTVPAWNVRLMQLQLSLTYFSTGLDKLKRSYWREGSAVYYATQSATFGHWHWLFQNPWLTRLATYSTLTFELGMLLIWIPRLRRKVLVAGYIFHCSIMLIMGIYNFQIIMLTALLIFLSEDEASRGLALVTRFVNRCFMRLSALSKL